MKSEMKEYNYIFVLGYDMLQNFLNAKKCECDTAFEFCKTIYSMFKNSCFDSDNEPEYDCLQRYIETLSAEQLDVILIDAKAKRYDKSIDGRFLKVGGEDIFLSTAVIDELHRQENIEWAKDIVENCSNDDFTIDFDDVTDDEFEAIAVTFENEMFSNDSNDMARFSIEEVLGEKFNRKQHPEALLEDWSVNGEINV